MVALAASVSGSRLAAEDIAQEAFVRAYRQWEKISAYESPGGWVRRVTINLAMNTRKRVASEARARVRLGFAPTLGPAPEPDEAVWRGIVRLPRRQRAAVALFYIEGLSTREIAEVLDCSESTVRVHLHKARRSLAKSLGDGS